MNRITQLTIALSIFSFLIVRCYGDTLTADTSSYSTGSPITLTFTTTSTYRQLDFTINTIPFKSITDTVNPISGTITVTGFVTCSMGPSIATTQLIIQVDTLDFVTGLPGPTSSVSPNPSYTFLSALCLAYFTTPANDPAEVVAATTYTVTFVTDASTSFADSYITLNSTLFCITGAVGTASSATCSGYVPCFLPSTAQLSIMGRLSSGGAYVAYDATAIDLVPNSQCSPLFAATLIRTNATCPGNAIAPLSTLEFTFTINANDDISQYVNFSIYATNPALSTGPIAIISVPGPLTKKCGATRFKYRIADWLIPCEFNRMTGTVFTLTYYFVIAVGVKIPAAQQITLDIGETDECNLTLILNYVGKCPLPYVNEGCQDCGIGKGSGCTGGKLKVPVGCRECGNNAKYFDNDCDSDSDDICSVDKRSYLEKPCDNLSATNVTDFVAGDVLNFYIHSGTFPSWKYATVEVVSSFAYYTSADLLTFSLSSRYFYTIDTVSGVLSYKPIQNYYNSTVAIPYTSASFLSGVAATADNQGTDAVWAFNATGDVYCGTAQAGLLLATPMPVITVISVSASNNGTFLLDSLGNIWSKSTVACNDGNVFSTVLSPGPTTLQISCAISGYYYATSAAISFAPYSSNIPISVPAGGPSTVLQISASALDNTLVVLDTSNAVWFLYSPTGSWTLLSTLVGYLSLANYGIYTMYAENLTGATYNVKQISLTPAPIFDIVPIITDISLLIQSTLSDVTVYQSPTNPPLNYCNNTYLASWIISQNYSQVGNATAKLMYTATFPDSTVLNLSSSVSFFVGPTRIDLLTMRNFCPAV